MRFKVIFLAALGLAACGTDQNQKSSETKDMSIPGSPAGQNQLIWQDNAVIYLGTCTAGQLPNRSNCVAQKTISYNIVLESLRRDFFSDLDSRKEKKQREISNLKNNHPVIVNLNHEISLIANDIATISAQRPAIEATKVSVTQNLNRLAEMVADYDEQIANVIERLRANPTNADLLRLKEVLESERAELVSQKLAAETQLAKIQLNLSELDARLAVKQAEKEAKTAERARKWNELQVTSDVLVNLDKEMLAIDVELQNQQRVLNLVLENNISHRSELLSITDRKIVARIIAAIQSTVEYYHSDVFNVVENGSRYGFLGSSIAALQVACRSVGRTYKSHESAVYSTSFYRQTYNCRGDEKNLLQCNRSNDGSTRDTQKIICE